MNYPRLATYATFFLISAAAAIAEDGPSPDSHSSNTALANPLAAQSLESLSATLDRPLFSPSRRPVVPAPAGQTSALPAPPAPPPDLVLAGIVMDGKRARAIVQIGAEKRILRAEIGDNIGGWTVSRIEERRLILSLDGRSVTFTLFSRGIGSDAGTQPVKSSVASQPLQSQRPSPSVATDIGLQKSKRRVNE